jgi:hypothetical protein
MAEWRKLYSDISTSLRLAQVSDRAALLYTWGLTQLDDDGRAPADPIWWKARVVPAREWTLAEVGVCLDELTSAGLLLRYNGAPDGRGYVQSPTWRDRQPLRKDRYRPSDHPAPPLDIPASNHLATKRQPSGTLDQTRPEKTRPEKKKQKTPLRKQRADGQSLSEHQQAVDYFWERWKQATGLDKPQSWTGGQLAKFVSRVVPQIGLLTWKRRAAAFFDEADDFRRKRGFLLDDFVKAFDGLGLPPDYRKNPEHRALPPLVADVLREEAST